MSREMISVSPGLSDGGGDLSQFCDSRGRGKGKTGRSQLSHRHCERSAAIQSRPWRAA